MPPDTAHLWPLSADSDPARPLTIAGCSLPDLAARHGTPLYLFDEATIRATIRACQSALAAWYPGRARVAYASKAWLCTALAQLMADEGADLDVVSGGELFVALRAGFPPERIHFHGNNKSPAELTAAVQAGIGRIVIDNFHELALLAALPRRADRLPVWLRLAPGITGDTHHHIQTGQEDTKFGFSLQNGAAGRAVALAMAAPGLHLCGLHSHIGSHIADPTALAEAARRLIDFSADMRRRHQFALSEFSPGGGWTVPMTPDEPPAPFDPWIAALSAAITDRCRAHQLPLPRLIVEPGRALIARAGVALYRVGARKELPGLRTWLALDGGMADNIRPALYAARYTARAVRPLVAGESAETVTLAGKFCESGDVLIQSISLPPLAAGDLVAVPMAGAYTLAMAGNYNHALRPAVLLLRDGHARLIQRRETHADLVQRDLPLRPAADAAPQPRRFHKYQALGNSYLVLDSADWPAPPTPDQIRTLCHPHYGPGSDGILWGPLPPAPGTPADHFALRLFNPDGSPCETSGNGLRIFARYLYDSGQAPGPTLTLEPPGGVVVAHLFPPAAAAGEIALQMGRIRLAGEMALSVAGQTVRAMEAHIGNPHCVLFWSDQDAAVRAAWGEGISADLARTIGPLLEQHPRFPQRTNVQFATVRDPHTVHVEIWERGAGYTLASGSSACAAAAAAIHSRRCRSPVTVQMAGGAVRVELSADGFVQLTGPATFVCAGQTGS